MSQIEYGDKVFYSLDGFEGVLFCIGSPNYAPDSVVVLADDDAHGMPINVKWCTPIAKHVFDKAERLRGRFIDTYGDNFLVAR